MLEIIFLRSVIGKCIIDHADVNFWSCLGKQFLSLSYWCGVMFDHAYFASKIFFIFDASKVLICLAARIRLKLLLDVYFILIFNKVCICLMFIGSTRV